MTLRNLFFYVVGLGFLALAKTKHVLQGYSTPKPIDIRDTERAVDYDFHVVEHWLRHLRQYGYEHNSLAGKNVLELGPGSDLGVGLLLLANGANKYNACDVNDLAKKVPQGFYEALFKRLHSEQSELEVGSLRTQLSAARAGVPSTLNYVVRDDFNLLEAFGQGCVDLVFSQAAFEHFDDVDATVVQLTAVCRPGAVIVAEIDLQTHSRWIRDKDPNNIYRFPEFVYRLFKFRGSPNRVRPYQYKEAFERNGWSNVTTTALAKLSDHRSAASGMSRTYLPDINEMDQLAIVLCARKVG